MKLVVLFIQRAVSTVLWTLSYNFASRITFLICFSGSSIFIEASVLRTILSSTYMNSRQTETKSKLPVSVLYSLQYRWFENRSHSVHLKRTYKKTCRFPCWVIYCSISFLLFSYQSHWRAKFARSSWSGKFSNHFHVLKYSPKCSLKFYEWNLSSYLLDTQSNIMQYQEGS